MTETLSSVIAGRRQDRGEPFDLRSPASGELLAQVHAADLETMDAAVRVARETFATTRWAGLAERVGWCERVAAAIERARRRAGRRARRGAGKAAARGRR